MKTACPRCNSPQHFSKRKRKISNETTEVYIECTVCHWTKVVFYGDSSRIRLYEEISKLKIRSQNDPSLRKVLQKKLKKLNRETNI